MGLHFTNPTKIDSFSWVGLGGNSVLKGIIEVRLFEVRHPKHRKALKKKNHKTQRHSPFGLKLFVRIAKTKKREEKRKLEFH